MLSTPLRRMQVAQLGAELRTAEHAGAAAAADLSDAQKEARSLVTSAATADDEARKLRGQLQTLEKRRQREGKSLKDVEGKLSDAETLAADRARQVDALKHQLSKVCIFGVVRLLVVIHGCTLQSLVQHVTLQHTSM